MSFIESGADSCLDSERPETKQPNDISETEARKIAFTPQESCALVVGEDLEDAAAVQVIPPEKDTPEATVAKPAVPVAPAVAAVASTVTCEERELPQPVAQERPSMPIAQPPKEQEVKRVPGVASPPTRVEVPSPTPPSEQAVEKADLPQPAEDASPPPEKATGGSSGGSGTIDKPPVPTPEDDDPNDKRPEREKPALLEAGKQPPEKTVPYDKSRLVFDKPVKRHPEIKSVLTKHLTEERRTIYEGEIVKSAETEQKIQDTSLAICELAQEIGVDVSARTTPPEHHHVFYDKENYITAVMQASGIAREEVNEMACGSSQGVFWRHTTDETLEDHIIAHETVHDMSIKFVKTTLRPGNKVSFEIVTGFDLPYKGVVEFVTDIAMLDVLQRMGKQDIASYAVLDAIGCALLERAAEFHGVEPKQVYHALLRDMFTGDSRGMALFAQGIGQKAFIDFLSIGGSESVEELQAFAGRVGLRELQQELETTDTPGFKAPWEKAKGRASGRKSSDDSQ